MREKGSGKEHRGQKQKCTEKGTEKEESETVK